MIRRTALGLLAGAAAGLALAVTADATTTGKKVKLNLGDVVAVNGSHTLCTVQKNAAAVPGKLVIECGYAGSRGAPVVGTYAVGLTSDGDVIALQVKSDGSAGLVYRKLAVRRATPKAYVVNVGDYVYVNGSSIVCPITSTNGVVTTGCIRLNSKGKVIGNSNGVGITDKFAFVSHFDAKLKVTILKTLVHKPVK